MKKYEILSWYTIGLVNLNNHGKSDLYATFSAPNYNRFHAMVSFWQSNLQLKLQIW